MCMICKDWELGKLTKKEAWRNLDELVTEGQTEEERFHYFELANKLAESNEEDQYADWSR